MQIIFRTTMIYPRSNMVQYNPVVAGGTTQMSKYASFEDNCWGWMETEIFH